MGAALDLFPACAISWGLSSGGGINTLLGGRNTLLKDGGSLESIKPYGAASSKP